MKKENQSNHKTVKGFLLRDSPRNMIYARRFSSLVTFFLLCNAELSLRQKP